MAAMLKTIKSLCLGTGVIDLHETWNSDTFWPCESYWQITFPIFTNARWLTAAILKNC